MSNRKGKKQRKHREEPRFGLDTPLPVWARRTGAVLAWGVGLVLVLSVVAVGWIGVRGTLAYSALRSAQHDIGAIRSQLSHADQAAASIRAAAVSTHRAHVLTSDPVWKSMEKLPWIGPQLNAVSTVASSIDTVAGTSLIPLTKVASSLTASSLKPHNGRIDLAMFTEVQHTATMSAQGMDAAASALEAANTPAVVAPLHSAVAQVASLLRDTADTATAAARASALLPAMLGADGPRNYLILFQNTAEWRSLGGMPGAQVLIHTDNGKMTLAGEDAASDFRPSDPPLHLPQGVAAIFGTTPGTWMHDVTQVPDFTVGAPLAAKMWQRKHGQVVDGVIATDPVALSYLLAATGQVTLSTGDALTSGNAVKTLLNRVYFRYSDPQAQDRFFTDATSAVFRSLAAGKADTGRLLTALVRAGNERRMLIWSAHPQDQSLLADTTLAGGLPPSDASATRFGVYLNDGTGSKMDYYQNASSAVKWNRCTAAGAGTVGAATLSVTVKNNAPRSGLPAYVTGAGVYGVTPGRARTVVYVYLPDGAQLDDAALSTKSGFGGGMHEGHRVLTYTVTLAPGQQATAAITVSLNQPGSSRLDVAQTPTVNMNVTGDNCENL